MKPSFSDSILDATSWTLLHERSYILLFMLLYFFLRFFYFFAFIFRIPLNLHARCSDPRFLGLVRSWSLLIQSHSSPRTKGPFSLVKVSTHEYRKNSATYLGMVLYRWIYADVSCDRVLEHIDATLGITLTHTVRFSVSRARNGSKPSSVFSPRRDFSSSSNELAFLGLCRESRKVTKITPRSPRILSRILFLFPLPTPFVSLRLQVDSSFSTSVGTRINDFLFFLFASL
jgi:hypothetical protein